MTAKELWSKHFDGLHWDDITPEKEQKYAIEFAKYHVEQALKNIYNSSTYGITSWCGNPYTGEGSDYLDYDKIIKIYPLENIK